MSKHYQNGIYDVQSEGLDRIVGSFFGVKAMTMEKRARRTAVVGTIE